ncbi:MAG: hypothetical protein Q8J92_10005 [Parvibaculum sp.]|uniref:hypothetical protein n=1 Tax=Parvibaculum sp. TaxID=2024848 RepID=UPI002715EBEE|nr:hypothetical protein [Parvibaculum sp.]MDO8838775.1 hypothetical protein [Parvibaculum sp.]MDP2124705.1 hypothetical protein [Parvibaculum sp.]
MPFINERIPEADKASIKSIQYPVGHSHDLSMWTVDREKAAFLVLTARYRDSPSELYFVLSILGKRYQVMLKQEIHLSDSGEAYEYFLESISGEGEAATEAVRQTLKEALAVFAGFYGTAKVASVKFRF